MRKKNIKKAGQVKDQKTGEDIIDSYLKEISKIPLLTREEEIKLAKEAANGNKAAQDKLVKGNLRFVVKIAKRYQGRGLPLLDLISEGNIGLIKAAENFDVERGFHFISYAVWWVRQSILIAIAEKSRPIRMPLHWNNKLIEIDRARQLSQDEQSQGNEIEKIASLTGIDTERVNELVSLGQDALSLEQPVNGKNNSSSFGDFLESMNHISPEDHALNISLNEEIEKALKTLGNREAEIIRFRYGLGNRQPMSLEELGYRYHISKEGVRQIENKAIKRLQASNYISRLEPYVA